MRQNKHTGAVHIPVGSLKDVTLRYDWEAIAALHGEYGKEWEGEVQRILAELDARGLAKILAIGSEHSEEWWIEQSPPFVPTATAVNAALHLAFFGAGGADDRPHIARRLMTLLSRRGKSGSSSAGEAATSGV